MRHGKPLAAALAGTLALSLVAAAAPTTSGPVGTASTTLSAVDLGVTTPVGDAALRLIDASTFASTATDTAVNPEGTPWANAILTPLTGPGGAVGRAEARSDGTTSVDAAGAALSGLGGPVADLAGTVNPASLTATAAAQEARAAIGTLTAEVSGLVDTLGIQVNVSGVASEVTATGASATQGLTVSEVEIALGDILPADVLATLPLPDLLALLESLPIDLPTDVQQLITQLRDALSALTGQLGDVTAAGDAVEAALTEITGINGALAGLNVLVAQRQALLDLDLTSPTAAGSLTSIGDAVSGAVGTVDAVTGGAGAGAIGTVTGTVGGVTGGVTGGLTGLSNHTTGCVDPAAITNLDALQAAVDCVTAVIDAELDALGVGSVAELQRQLDALVAQVTTLVNQLLATIQGLVPALGTVTSLAVDLGDLLAQLDSLLADAAGTPLVSVTAFDLGINSVSDGTVDGSTATVLCQPVTVTILDRSVSTPSCEAGLSAVSDASALVNGLLGTLTDTLNTLPVADIVSTGDLRVDLFSDLQRSVVEDGDAVVATAGVTALDLELPSLTIDPTPVTGILGGLGLPDILGQVQALLADTLAQVQATGVAALGTVTTTLTTATGQLGVAGGLEDLVGQLEAVLQGLDLSQLGTLDRISTPSVTLVIDPISTASFAPGTKVPAGAPEPTPSLPNTGGGLALLSLATMGGAWSLRRRR